MGFKNTGKSVVGEYLAHRLQVPFFDLDRQVEAYYFRDSGETCGCREIMQREGEASFRVLEIKALTLLSPGIHSVIALGGGTSITPDNLPLLRPCTLIHLSAHKETVFQRILQGGRPAYFDEVNNLTESLDVLWQARTAQYEQLADFTVANNGTVSGTVAEIISLLGGHSIQ